MTEVRPDDNAVAFFERADEALYRAKAAGKGKVVSVAASQGGQREGLGAKARGTAASR